MRLATGRKSGAFAPTLNVPYPALESAGLRLRRGQLSLTVAAPGVGKSQLFQNISHRCGEPTLYWSADTDRHDVTVRAVAMWSGKTTDDVDNILDDPSWGDWPQQQLLHSSHVEWVFDSHITAEGVKDRLLAFAERHGEYPHLLVIDNLSNTVSDMSDELAEMKAVVTSMQDVARQTGAHVALLAHSKGEYENGSKPIPQGGALNNLMKWAEVGITLHRDEDGKRLGVNLVKLRGGNSDPAAKRPIYLPTNLACATVMGFR